MKDIHHIMVGVDGSDNSRQALEWAHGEAVHHGASLTLVTTWNPPTLPVNPSMSTAPPEAYGTQPKEDALDLLESFTSDLASRTPAVDVRTSIEEGSPAEVLIQRSKGCDLLVVGSRGHGGFAGMLLGSVTQHLVAHAHCPVVVVR